MSMTQLPPPPTPAGWYPDPAYPDRLRYWDGRAWAAQEASSVDPVHEVAGEAPPGGPPRRRRRWSWAALALLCIAAVTVGVVVAVTGWDRDDDPTARPAPTATGDAEPSVDPEIAAQAARERARRAALRADKTNYKAATIRQWQLVAKNPDAHIGELYAVFGRVVQADTGTGTTTIRINTAGQQVEAYDYEINTLVTEGEFGLFEETVEDDLVRLWVEVSGSTTYETTMGGSVTAPLVTAYQVDRYGSAS